MPVQPSSGMYDVIVIAVGHQQYNSLGEAGTKSYPRADCAIVYDIKRILPIGAADGRL
jgi:UDP-N-acetyl-D-galactosamine dehydrogenase